MQVQIYWDPELIGKISDERSNFSLQMTIAFVSSSTTNQLMQ
ncbi:MAG: hypothetical protein CM1200mP40_14370 [Gammaproteobacteria bacterium]|nr:MAG: hypothetical protein CM1200mP40_14370 [Gammaproteobacteria bacterium]